MTGFVSRTVRERWPYVLLAVAIALAGVFVLRYGFAAHDLQLDEFDTVSAGRRFDDSFFRMLFSVSPVGRGPERLSALAYAGPNALFNNTATVFRASHVLFGLLYISAALPVYAMARGMGLARWQAIFPAAAAILTPWLLFGGTLLNITLAYPTAMGLAWATWRAMSWPGWRTDVLVLVFAVAATMARESNALFVVAVGLAVILQTWRDREPDKPMRDSLRAYPGRLVRSHPLLVGVAFAVVAIVVIYGEHRLLGSAYQPTASSHPVSFETVLNAIWKAAGELTIGTGLLPMIVALPWIAHELLRPRRRESWSFAVVAIGMFAAFVAMVVYFAATTSGAADDERYVAVLAGLPPLAAAVALFRREVHPLWVALSGLLLARAVVTQGLYPATGPYDYFLAPARLFFTVVMQGQLSSHLPFSDHHIATTLMLIAVAAAVAVAVVLAWTPGRSVRLSTTAVTLALGVPIALGAASGIYDGNHFEALATFPTLTFEQQTFVDSATGHGSVAVWDYAPGGDLRIAYEANQASFFNRSVDATLHLAGMTPTANVGRQITANLDWRTGELRLSSPLSPYLLVPARFTKIGFAATGVAPPSLVFGPMPFSLERLRGKPQAGYAVQGTEDEGWIASPGRTAVVRLFASRAAICWQTDVVAPPQLTRPVRYSVVGPHLRQRGTLSAASAAVLNLRSPSIHPVTVRINVAAGGGRLADGVAVAAGIYAFTQTRCPARQ